MGAGGMINHKSNYFLLSIVVLSVVTSFIPFGNFIPNAYATQATGGTITYSGGYTIHTFTTSGTFTVTQAGSIQYLVVAGGGGGGSGQDGNRVGGSAGGGGYRNGTAIANATSYSITVGAGGAGAVGEDANGSKGSDSIFSTRTSTGGGYGGGAGNVNPQAGGTGGSGGGTGGFQNTPKTVAGGTGNTPATSPVQGYDGGSATIFNEGGGGSSCGAGATAGVEGLACSSSISGTSKQYGMGGGRDPTPNTANSGNGGDGGTSSTDEAGQAGIVIIRYLTTPVPPSNLSCTGLPYSYSCSWTAINATSVSGYYISKSTNNSTWTDITGLSNVTSTTYSGFGVNSANYIRVNATNNGANSTSSNVVLSTTDNYPDAPTIVAIPASFTQINIERTAGASNGGDTVDDYRLFANINSGGWTTLVSNSTIVNFYNHTGLTAGDSVSYRWGDGNDVGWSNNGTASGQTYITTTGSNSASIKNIGDVLNATTTVIITNAVPSPVTVTSVLLLQNGTTVKTDSESQSVASGQNVTLSSKYYLLPDGLPHAYKTKVFVTNAAGTVNFTSATTNITREYNPDYFEAIDPTQGNVNYTISRTVDQNQINLKTNRQEGGNVFQIECRYRSMTDAALDSGGIWHNYTNVGYMNDTLTDAAGTHYYIDCYNDGKLFTVVSYTNSSMLLAGIEVFDDTYGAFIGVPVGVFFIVLVAGMANQRTAPMWIIVILAIAGIMSAIGFFTLETNVWALALIAALLGIIVGRKLF